MPNFNLHLTGVVGSASFHSAEATRVLNQYPGKHVDVLIDSQGGQLAHGLSIADAFRNHGDVTAHLRGMCASAATIASMGAKKVTMAPDAFYLVHQVSMVFFDWSSHNADSLDKYIEELKAAKDDLDTLDRSVAQTYASRCRKPVDNLLQLMKEGKWLTAQQALDWGFIDEITPYEQQPASPKITRAQASAFAAQGIPLPPVPVVDDPVNQSLFSEFFKSLKSFLKMDNTPQNQNPNPEPAPQNQAPQNQAPQNQASQNQNPEPENFEQTIAAKDQEIEKLKAEIEALKKQPAADTTEKPANSTGQKPENNPSALESFMKVSADASTLFNALP